MSENVFLKRLSISWALRKPTPKRFSLDEDNQNNIDYYSVRLAKRSSNERFLARSIEKKCVIALAWEENKFSQRTEIPFSELNSYDIEITHFYRHLRVKYVGVSDFLWGQVSLHPRRYILADRIEQRRYNSKTKFRHDRIEILRELLRLRLSKASDDFAWIFDDNYEDETELFRTIYGDRVFGYEHSDRELAQFHFLLESLVASRDVEKSERKYRVADQAIKSVAEYEEQERRHQDNVIHNNRLFWITVVLALAALTQIAVAIYY